MGISALARLQGALRSYPTRVALFPWKYIELLSIFDPFGRVGVCFSTHVLRQLYFHLHFDHHHLSYIYQLQAVTGVGSGEFSSPVTNISERTTR